MDIELTARLRKLALEAALRCSTHANPYPKEVIRDAELFYQFLMGAVEVDQKCFT